MGGVKNIGEFALAIEDEFCCPAFITISCDTRVRLFGGTDRDSPGWSSNP